MKRLNNVKKAIISIAMMIIVSGVQFTTIGIEKQAKDFDSWIHSSGYFARIDDVNITQVEIEYLSGDYFLYNVYGYFVDTTPPIASPSTCIVSIEYMNFTVFDKELLMNGSEYSSLAFDATIYDGVTSPDLMILPVSNYISSNFKETFVIKYKIPVMIYKNASLSANIVVKLTDFINANDSISLGDDDYDVTYDLKTNLIINSQHFSKANVIVNINDAQVDPYDFHVGSPVFDLKIYDIQYKLLYHDPSVDWKSDLVVGFTSAKITNSFYTSVLASIAPISTVNNAFYQTDSSNYSRNVDRFMMQGSFSDIYQGAGGLLYGSDENPTSFIVPTLPGDVALIRQWEYNVFDINETMIPTSMKHDAVDAQYPCWNLLYQNVMNVRESSFISYWMYTPPNTSIAMFVNIMDAFSGYNISSGIDFSFSIINSTLYETTTFFNGSFSFGGIDKIMSLAPETWYHFAILRHPGTPGKSDSNFTLFVNFNPVYEAMTNSTFVSDISFGAINKTAVQGWDGDFTSLVANTSAAAPITYNMANTWSYMNTTYEADNIIINGESSVEYINSDTFKWKSKSSYDYYHAVDAIYQNTRLDDFGNFMYVPDKILEINESIVNGDYGPCFGWNKVEIMKTLDGHENVLNYTSCLRGYSSPSTIYVDPFNSPGSGQVDFGGTVVPYENWTIEFWVNAKDENESAPIWFHDGGYGEGVILRFNASASMMHVTFRNGYSYEFETVDVPIANISAWNHVRFDVRIKNGSLSNYTTTIYVNGVEEVSRSYMTTGFYRMIIYDTFATTKSINHLYIDAIGIWRSSWESSDMYRGFYEIGRNMKKITPTYPNGQFTFDTSTPGDQITSVDPAFYQGSPKKNEGNIIFIDDVHDNAYNLLNTNSWTSFFGLDNPDVEPVYYLFPNGYGYDVRGRVAFWLYINSSYNSARFKFSIYDDAGTRTVSTDDTVHGFSIGNSLDDTKEQSNVIYFDLDGTTPWLRKTSYAVSNDTWNYFVFEWNSTGNSLVINQQTIFHGDVIKPEYANTQTEFTVGNMSLSTYIWENFASRSAMAYFSGGAAIPVAGSRTMFSFVSIPTINYVSQYDSSGATWRSSCGLLDNLNFEYDTTVPHDYSPAAMVVDQASSNFTVHSSLSRTFTTSMWSDFNLYEGAFYNVSFFLNATNGSYPIQVICDSTTYVVFPTNDITLYHVLHRIDVTRSEFTVKIWSTNGTYWIENFTVTLTSRTPQLIDSFKKYMHDYSIYSEYIGTNAISLTNITAGTYYVIAESIPTTDVAFFDVTQITNGSNYINILPPSLRDITIEYTDQRGISAGNVRTYLLVGETFQLIPGTVFQAEIGTTITLLSRNVFNEIVFYGSYTVRSFSNYINVIVTVHSLMIYNQDEHFVNYTITKSFAPGFYWSRYLYPKTGAEEKLTSGSYAVRTRDYLGNTVTYSFNIFGDDYLLIDSDLTIENAINNIRNVNSTIGNQITNVGINITNQNSAINNSIVNVDINISNLNTTLGTQLLSMQANIISVNTTIDEQTSYITTLMANINSTIFSQTSYITSLIANVNASIDNQTTILTSYFTNINSTIGDQYDTITTILVNINNTIGSMNVNLTQAFFTDLMNNQTSNLTGYITQVVNDQSNFIQFQLNNLTGAITNQTLNLEYQIYNQTLLLNGSFAVEFNQITSSNDEIRRLIRSTDFSLFVNWSDNSEILGIIELKIMNGYAYPIIVELKFRGHVINYTIYSSDYISEFVPTGTYLYRLSRLTTGEFLARFASEPSEEWDEFKTIFFDNSSRTIDTTFASIPVGQVPSMLESTQIAVFVVIGMIGLIIFLLLRNYFKKKDARKKMDVAKALDRKNSNTPKAARKDSSQMRRRPPSISKARPGSRHGGVL